jgi:hypothetical protein
MIYVKYGVLPWNCLSFSSAQDMLNGEQYSTEVDFTYENS